MTALLMRDLKLAFRAGGGFGFAILFFFLLLELLIFVSYDMQEILKHV